MIHISKKKFKMHGLYFVNNEKGKGKKSYLFFSHKKKLSFSKFFGGLPRISLISRV